MSVLGVYPDCNFTESFGGWKNHGKRDWVIVNETVKNVGILAGRQGSCQFFYFLQNEICSLVSRQIRPSFERILNFYNICTCFYKSRPTASRRFSQSVPSPSCVRFIFLFNKCEKQF